MTDYSQWSMDDLLNELLIQNSLIHEARTRDKEIRAWLRGLEKKKDGPIPLPTAHPQSLEDIAGGDGYGGD